MKSIAIVIVICALLMTITAVPIRCAHQTINALEFDEEEIILDVDTVIQAATVNCLDKNVCVIECNRYITGCTKNVFFDLKPLLKYETLNQNPDDPNNKWFEEYQAYREVCIKRAGVTANPESTEIYKIFNQKIAAYLGLSVSYVNSKVFQGDMRNWSHNYEHMIRGLRVSEEKKAAAEAFSKFVWAIRSFKRICQNNPHSYSTVLSKFYTFDAEYKQRMFRAGGADYSFDPGLYAYLNEHQFLTYRDIYRSQGNTALYNSFAKKLYDYRSLKNSVLSPVITLLMRSTYYDYCKCYGFNDWYNNYRYQSAHNLWYYHRITKSKLNVFPGYLHKMYQECQKVC